MATNYITQQCGSVEDLRSYLRCWHPTGDDMVLPALKNLLESIEYERGHQNRVSIIKLLSSKMHSICIKNGYEISESKGPIEEIRALSWKEPYASLMLVGKIETRSWNTDYRGLVLICTSISSYRLDQILNISGRKHFSRIIDLTSNYHLKAGKAIAIGRLVDCRKMLPEDEDKCFVKYSPALYCHVYENVQAIEPFEWKGSQGWKKLSDEQKQLIQIKQ